MTENNSQNQTLSYLGERFELKLLNQIIGIRQKKGTEVFRDFAYGKTLIPIISPSVFSIKHAKTIMELVIDFYKEFDLIPYYDTIRELINLKVPSNKNEYIVFLNEVENVYIENADFVKKNAKRFIQQQNLLLEIESVRRKILDGKIDSFENTVDNLKKTIVVNDIDNNINYVTSENYEFVSKEDRFPIPTGIKMLDECWNGGIGRGEFVLVIAAYKVGKTTFAVNLATSAFMAGKTVLYIFFEDKPSEIQMKMQAKWSGLSINNAANKKNQKVVENAFLTKLKKGEELGGKLILQKMPSYGVKMSQIERLCDNITQMQNTKIDMIIIDYLECIDDDREYEDAWKGEGKIARRLEHLCSQERINCASVVFTQGSRGMANQNDTDDSKGGGSLKKQQVAHGIITIASTPEQKEAGLANLSIKGRLGKDKKFQNIIFDHETLKIEIHDENIVNKFQK